EEERLHERGDRQVVGENAAQSRDFIWADFQAVGFARHGDDIDAARLMSIDALEVFAVVEADKGNCFSIAQRGLVEYGESGLHQRRRKEFFYQSGGDQKFDFWHWRISFSPLIYRCSADCREAVV